MYLIYCNTIWTNIYPTRLRPIYLIQKKKVRIMTFSKYKEEKRPLFISLKVLNIYELNMYFTALFMYSYFDDKPPMFYRGYFTTNNKIHSYDTRIASNISIHFTYKRTNYGTFSLKYQGAIVWNSLPANIKESKSYKTFKNSLKTYIQQESFLNGPRN